MEQVANVLDRRRGKTLNLATVTGSYDPSFTGTRSEASAPVADFYAAIDGLWCPRCCP